MRHLRIQKQKLMGIVLAASVHQTKILWLQCQKDRDCTNRGLGDSIIILLVVLVVPSCADGLLEYHVALDGRAIPGLVLCSERPKT